VAVGLAVVFLATAQMGVTLLRLDLPQAVAVVVGAELEPD
jgi:hypothetical protein